MPSEDLWGVTTEAMAEVTSASAWVERMVSVEAALSRALSEVGVAPAGTVPLGASLDVASIVARSRVAGTPVIPLVADLVAEFGPSVHVGATSQDIIDVGLALTGRTAVGALAPDAERCAAALAELAGTHRTSVVAGRTLLQQGAPTSFGLVAAGWLTGIVDAWAGLLIAARAVPAQLGGPVGTLSALGTKGPEVLTRFARDLGLPEPTLAWHTNRQPIARVAAALAILAGSVHKVAADLALHAQTEIGEVAERSEPGRGTSSAMPHKRNPVASVRAMAAARQVAPIAGGILAGMADHPFQRAVGAWQAEVPALNSMYGFVAVALESLADALRGLHVDGDRMRANLDPRGGWSAEAASVALTPHLGREGARTAVAAASDAARTNGTALLAELRAAMTADAVPADVLEAAGDPAALLGSSSVFIDRALAHYRESALHP